MCRAVKSKLKSFIPRLAVSSPVQFMTLESKNMYNHVSLIFWLQLNVPFRKGSIRQETGYYNFDNWGRKHAPRRCPYGKSCNNRGKHNHFANVCTVGLNQLRIVQSMWLKRHPPYSVSTRTAVNIRVYIWKYEMRVSAYWEGEEKLERYVTSVFTNFQ